MTKQELIDYIQSLTKEYEELAREHQGVRPSWVSTDLSLLDHRISELKKEL